MKKKLILPFVVLITLGAIVACQKSKADKINCKFCKVHGPDLNIIDSAQICTDDEETALHNKYPGRTITCQ